ncbi:unnamed protein product, partial [Ceratitis capitata]
YFLITSRLWQIRCLLKVLRPVAEVVLVYTTSSSALCYATPCYIKNAARGVVSMCLCEKLPAMSGAKKKKKQQKVGKEKRNPRRE